jgi:hypothetical protein
MLSPALRPRHPVGRFLGDDALRNEDPLNSGLGEGGSDESENERYPDDLSEVIDFSSYDLRTTLRLIVLSGESRRVDVQRGRRRGSIFIKGGEIYSVFTANDEGDEAFFEILSWEGAVHSDVQQVDSPAENVRVPTRVILDLLKKDVTRPTW